MQADRILAGATAVLAVLYLWGASRIPKVEIGDPLGPSAFPMLLGGLLLIGAALLAWETRGKVADATKAWISAQDLKSTTGVIAWIALYLLAYEPLGYVLSTLLFMVGLTFWFNRGKWISNILVSAGFSIGAYLLFGRLLNGNLPHGFLPV